MNNEEKELLINKQKAIIDKILSHLVEQGLELYYEPTMNICREIEEIIHNNNFLNVKEKEAVEMLNSNDIQTLMSYNSNCC